MSHITTYTSDMSLPITYQWKCSKCGEINRVSTTVHTTGESFSFGIKVDTESQNYASSQAQGKMTGALRVLCGERGSYSSYRRIGLNSACKKCGYKEYWAVRQYDGPPKFIISLGIFALFGCVLTAGFSVLLLLFGSGGTGSNWTPLICSLVIAGLIIGLYFLVRLLNDQDEIEMNKKIGELPFSSLPVLVIDDVPVVDADLIEKRESENAKKKEIDSLKTNTTGQQNKGNTPNNDRIEYKQTNDKVYSAADEIEKFKGLFDKGIITQDEFEAKKKQLLGL